MKEYHPKSWSAQARELSDRIAENVNSGAWCLEQASRFWGSSYRHALIVMRAANRFGRLIREGKVFETPESVTKWHTYKKEHDII